MNRNKPQQTTDTTPSVPRGSMSSHYPHYPHYPHAPAVATTKGQFVLRRSCSYFVHAMRSHAPRCTQKCRRAHPVVHVRSAPRWRCMPKLLPVCRSVSVVARLGRSLLQRIAVTGSRSAYGCVATIGLSLPPWDRDPTVVCGVENRERHG